MSANDSDDEAPELVEIPNKNRIIPVSLLTGFLGSGKTTLLNYILTSNHGKRIAVIENEFSEGLGIESMIAKSGVNGEDISNFFELPNGCICCTIKDDLLSTLEQLVLHQDKFDYILIETTGLANPGPIIGTFWTDDGLDSCLKLDGVVCVVDSLNIARYLETSDIATDVQLQICYADRLILNKADLVPQDKMDDVLSLVKGINGLAAVQSSSYSKVDLDFVLNLNNYSSSGGDEMSSHLISSQYFQCAPCLPSSASQQGASLVAVHNTIKPGHIANDMRTISFKIEGNVVLRRLQLCMDRLLYGNDGNGSHGRSGSLSNASEIFRVKGILHLSPEKPSPLDETDYSVLHSLQAVHQLFEILPTSYKVDGPGDTTEGMNLFIVIGKNLDALLIESELRQCLI